MNYPQQIAFMQRFECAAGGLSGKHLRHTDVRSLATGRLLAIWTLGTLKPADGSRDSTNPGTSAPLEGENRIGLTGKPVPTSLGLPLRDAARNRRRRLLFMLRQRPGR